jgi:lysophospholipase L1-like esterase
LEAAGITNIDFVGTLPAQGCGVPYDGDNDGHGGFLATGIVSDNQLPGWLAVSQPDIVMMELATNDVWNNIPTATILAAFSTLVDQMRASKSTMRILVAQITPMSPSGCTTCAAGVVALNNAIPAWAAGKSTSASPITVVDCFTGYNTATDTGDGVHPNDSGNTKLANAWFPPLQAAILAAGSGTTPVSSTKATTTTKAPATTTTTPPANTGSAGTVPLYGQCGW